MVEIVYVIIWDEEERCPETFTMTDDCMRLMFGLDMMERNATVLSSSFVHALRISSDGM